MIIIGLNYDMHIASAALVKDGELLAAVAEERLSRDKRSRHFPVNSIKYCLDQAGCTIEDVDYFASSWNPGAYLTKFNPLVSNNRRSFSEHLYSVPDHIFSLFPAEKRNVDYLQQKIAHDEGETDIYYLTHHRVHAANGFFLSPFDDAAILTIDSQGELESVTLAMGNGNQITHIDSLNYPNSLGAFYSAITEYLGFRPNSDEWKVMALASYEDADNQYYDFFKKEVLTLGSNGFFELNLSYITGFLHEQPHNYSPLLVERLGLARSEGEPVEQRHYQIAAAMQHIAEDVVFHLLKKLFSETRCTNLVLSGGFFMNSVLNGKIKEKSDFDNVFVSSCPDDSGNAIGAAYYLYNHILGNVRGSAMKHNYLGPEFSNEEIELILAKFKLQAHFVDEVEKYAAQCLADGAVIGWFQGRMEFGQRALGHRSILADPRSLEMKDRVNASVKYREAFRPFAPAILAERFKEYFDADVDAVPFMEKVFPIRKDKQPLIPAVTHVDGSGRVQTVDASIAPKFYQLIKEFEGITGIPVVMNTSFNLNGEPIVCSPEDAIRTFHSSGLDFLILGNYVLSKS
jgi:carbamoyltransferase